jgi:hypothetical protein
MFHFPTFPPHTLYIQMQVTRHHSCWVSPFGHPRITARLTAPRGLSQPPTSFIGSWCQGIHRTLFITYNKDARVHCAILKQHTQPRLTAAPATPITPERATRTRYDHHLNSVYVLPRKKHSRVLSGPNSASIYLLPAKHSSLTDTQSMVVSVPPVSTAG